VFDSTCSDSSKRLLDSDGAKTSDSGLSPVFWPLPSEVLDCLVLKEALRGPCRIHQGIPVQEHRPPWLTRKLNVHSDCD
jgi:hypothetical protein